ncbi:hypothetical protein EVAR_57777_1 [Eumeta japonica]|uniref:Uncharacterized protein n=1 Tax=Eumeta variegata TaxID=151549 RepID=A0A4C1Y8V2_EUMVA|nr:hypothetical protein EVAR_57777_1 [Eumeta japonica]
MNSSGISHRCTEVAERTTPPQRTPQDGFPLKSKYTARDGPHELEPRKGATTIRIRRGRIPDEKTPGHEATKRSPSRTCDQRKVADDPRTNGPSKFDWSKINPSNCCSVKDGQTRVPHAAHSSTVFLSRPEATSVLHQVRTRTYIRCPRAPRPVKVRSDVTGSTPRRCSAAPPGRLSTAHAKFHGVPISIKLMTAREDCNLECTAPAALLQWCRSICRFNPILNITPYTTF